MKLSTLIASGLLCIGSSLAQAATPAPVKLWRLDCGALRVDDLNEYSDTFAYVGKTARFTVSCYLIRHGDTYMLWDLGLSDSALGLPLTGPGSDSGETLAKSLPEQLAAINITPQQIEIIGISHYHFDHTGQAHHFPQARLLMGKGDIKALQAPGSTRAKPLANWIGGTGKIEEVEGDKDIFGDQSVVMLQLPGHTPGHHGLLIKLAQQGYVLLSGDVVHFQENYTRDGVPIFNVDRAQSLASLSRFKEIARNLPATVIIQHEQDHIAKLPTFPAFAQ